MKVSKFYFPLLAAGMLASCSSENDPVIDNGNNNGEVRYLAVNISNPASSTRADLVYDYENGTAAEDKVNSSMFILIDNSGWQIASAVDLTWDNDPYDNANKPYNPNVENIAKAVLVVENAKGKTSPTQLLVILNPAFTKEDIQGKTTEDLLNYIKDYGTHEAGTFVMSNSAYYDNGSPVRTTEVKPTDFYTSAEAAKNGAVNVYVERVVAKVKTNAIAAVDNKGASETINGEEKKLNIVIDGIGVTNFGADSYLVKNLGTWGNETTWSNSAIYRSFWATTTNTTRVNPSWNALYEEGDERKYNLGSAMGGNTAKTLYVQENTIQTDDPEYRACVIVAAHLETEDGNPFNLVRIANEYYDSDNALTMVGNWLLSNSEYGVKDDEKVIRSITSSELVWAQPEGVSLEAYEAYPQVAETAKDLEFVNKKGETVSVDDINKALTTSAAYKSWVWNGGKCYYYANITDSKIGHPGLVRNTIYDLKLEEIKGIGTPVVDPTKDIIPEKPSPDETFWNLAAKVNILQWRIVSESVSFDGEIKK